MRSILSAHRIARALPRCICKHESQRASKIAGLYEMPATEIAPP